MKARDRECLVAMVDLERVLSQLRIERREVAYLSGQPEPKKDTAAMRRLQMAVDIERERS
jgi:hypothetical protein